MEIDWKRVWEESSDESMFKFGFSIKTSRVTRKRLLEEMVEWPRGNLENYSENVPSRKTGWAKQIHTSVYKSDGFNVGVLAPGKEASNDSLTRSYSGDRELKPNHNDVLPVVTKLDRRVNDVDLTFGQMFEHLVRGGESSPDGLLILSAMMYRNGYCYDHQEQSDGNFRLIIPPYSLSVLRENIPNLGDYPIETQIYFLDLLATNEDAKVYALGLESFGSYGRVNTLLTFTNICAFLLGTVSLAELCYSFARFPRGMAPITKKGAEEIFRMLSERAGN